MRLGKLRVPVALLLLLLHLMMHGACWCVWRGAVLCKLGGLGVVARLHRLLDQARRFAHHWQEQLAAAWHDAQQQWEEQEHRPVGQGGQQEQAKRDAEVDQQLDGCKKVSNLPSMSEHQKPHLEIKGNTVGVLRCARAAASSGMASQKCFLLVQDVPQLSCSTGETGWWSRQQCRGP